MLSDTVKVNQEQPFTAFSSRDREWLGKQGGGRAGANRRQELGSIHCSLAPLRLCFEK